MRHGRSYNRSIFRPLIALIIDRYLAFYCCSWVLVSYTRKLGIPIPLINNWLTDFVFVPLLIHVPFVLGSLIFIPDGTFKYPIYQILSIALLVSLVFECCLPRLTAYNTADFYDILAYFAGGVFYYAVHQSHTSKKIRLAFEKRQRLDQK